MGIKTVAEYAENDAIIQELRSMGMDYAQGYGVCKPKPLFEGTWGLFRFRELMLPSRSHTQSRLLRFLTAAALSATACCQMLHAAQGADAGAAATAKLLISGSTTMAPMVSEIARRFEVRYPGTRVEVRSVGSGRGIGDLRAGTSSIAMASRPLLDSERDLFAFPIARDGVALIVNRDNPVKGLSAQQARSMITGKINNWKTVGGRDAAVMLIWRTKGRGLVELLAEQLNFSHAEVSTQAAIVDDDALIKDVESHPSAITPISVGQAELRMQAGARIKLLVFGGITASVKTVRNGSYPLSRPLSLVTRRLPEGAEKRFIDFALSGHVADLFAKYDFVAYEE